MPSTPRAYIFDIYLGQSLKDRLDFVTTYKRTFEQYKNFHALFEQNFFDENTTRSFAELINELDAANLKNLMEVVIIDDILIDIYQLGHATHELNAKRIQEIQIKWLNKIRLQPRIRSLLEKSGIVGMGMLLGLSISLISLAGILIAMTGTILVPSLIATILLGCTGIGCRIPKYPFRGAVAGLVIGLLVIAGITLITQGAALPLMAMIIPLVLTVFLGAYFTHKYYQRQNAAEPIKQGEKINEKSNALAQNIHNFFMSKEKKEDIQTNWPVVKL